jgi:GNAT superfamily N-acetyltransferase
MTTGSASTDTTLTDLVRRWERGWSASRGWATPQEAGGGLHLLQHRPGRYREILALHDNPAVVRALADEAAADGKATWLTVPTTDPDDVERVLRDAGLHVKDTREWLMARGLADHPRRAVPDHYRTTAGGTGVVRVEVLHPSGEPAASGQAAITGEDAVFDRIETAPTHRRRGLGSVVMANLAAVAVTRGARHGILVASPDGQALYATLGWTTAAAVVIATNQPDA